MVQGWSEDPVPGLRGWLEAQARGGHWESAPFRRWFSDGFQMVFRWFLDGLKIGIRKPSENHPKTIRQQDWALKWRSDGF